MEMPSPISPRQAAQWTTPSRRWKRGSSGGVLPQTAQPSSSGSYPDRHMAFSSKAALTNARGFSFILSSACRLFNINESSSELATPSTANSSATSAK